VAIQKMARYLRLVDCFRASPLAMTEKVKTCGDWYKPLCLRRKWIPAFAGMTSRKNGKQHKTKLNRLQHPGLGLQAGTKASYIHGRWSCRPSRGQISTGIERKWRLKSGFSLTLMD
jgi:hypothetical protein